MNLWNIQVLAKKLANNQISEKDGMAYYLTSSLLLLFATYYALWWGVTRDWLFYSELVILSVITIYGCIRAFEINGGENGTNFIQRAIVLSVPVGIRVNILAIGFGLLLYFSAEHIFTYESFGNPMRAYTLVGYVGFVGFSVYFWWLLISGFKIINSNS